ncbi:hypothetical protein T440DRAFT_314638 [Plenodomus tracheiphilus IPT5]|uniref:Uncharacterized protein n=1 Tax=Plenodomus tracheiphilus IPT5 TaxID=1408161 RepID=A0A6A7AN67_9PLEO|nr:hypothetical protein T440DRAFT_314638 [Plenodomus tracheiphilus IPT5]
MIRKTLGGTLAIEGLDLRASRSRNAGSYRNASESSSGRELETRRFRSHTAFNGRRRTQRSRCAVQTALFQPKSVNVNNCSRILRDKRGGRGQRRRVLDGGLSRKQLCLADAHGGQVYLDLSVLSRPTERKTESRHGRSGCAVSTKSVLHLFGLQGWRGYFASSSDL